MSWANPLQDEEASKDHGIAQGLCRTARCSRLAGGESMQYRRYCCDERQVALQEPHHCSSAGGARSSGLLSALPHATRFHAVQPVSPPFHPGIASTKKKRRPPASLAFCRRLAYSGAGTTCELSHREAS